MSEAEINKVVNKYVKDNLSPKPEQRDDITKKYAAICEVLGAGCFQSGSYARFTAIHPVHDLDIIYVVTEVSIKTDPEAYMNALCEILRTSDIEGIKDVKPQTHSVTIVFEYDGHLFTVDIVPAFKIEERNEPYHDPMYEVPEILKLNKHHRTQRYRRADRQPIKWVKSDPRGYIRSASDLDNDNPNFRHATKFGKGWRHACKVHDDEGYRFKSFHFEQIFFKYMSDNPGVGTVQAIIDCFARIPQALQRPQFKDRADPNVYIDEYVRTLTDAEKKVVIQMQSQALELARQIPGATSEAELISILDKIMAVRPAKPIIRHSARVVSSVRQPWAT